MTNLRKEKVHLRNRILAERDSLSISAIRDKSMNIKKILFSLREFKDAKNIMFFVSFRSEVMTAFMIKEALEMDKSIIIPLAEKHSNKLKIFYINDFNNDLTIGAYGILEPMMSQCKVANVNDLNIVIVPGSVFAPTGERLGYGVGYYDRFLASLSDHVTKIALAFEFQISENVPSGEKDVKMDMIITEKRVINCK